MASRGWKDSRKPRRTSWYSCLCSSGRTTSVVEVRPCRSDAIEFPFVNRNGASAELSARSYNDGRMRK